jgi:hypothetical protein
MVRYLTIVTLAFASLPSAGFAQSASEQKACRADVVRYCRRDIDSGQFAIADCLKAHRERLTHACRAVLASHGI